MKLQVTGNEVFNDATPGTVVDINPSGPVQPGDTITVSYSKGPQMVTVPTIPAGASEAEVQQAIENAGLRWAKGADVSPTNEKEDPGTFVSSEPAPGSQGRCRQRCDLPPGRRRRAASPSPTSPRPRPP